MYRTTFYFDQILLQPEYQPDDMLVIDGKMGFQQDAGFGHIKGPSHPLLDNLVIFIQADVGKIQ
jgi:hypothetical protein